MTRETKDPSADYEEWERRMGAAADHPPCTCLGRQGPYCTACKLNWWWDEFDGIGRGFLYEGMVAQGFEWKK